MAKSKSDKLKRLVAVQRHMERIAEIDLAGTAASRQEIADRIEHAVDAIGSFEPVHAGLKTQYAIQYSRLSARDSQLEQLQQVQEQRFLREKAKGDRLEANRVKARDLEDRAKQDDDILDLLEITMAAPASSKVDGT